jgi:DNA-binding GntR family transcriptional regulator
VRQNKNAPEAKLGSLKNVQFLTDQVYDILKEAILSLNLAPGNHLVESKLAKQLGTSTTPIRGALARLKHDNLVEIVPFKGARVSKIDSREMDEIFEIRVLMETAMIRKFANSISTRDIKEGEALLEAMRQAYKSGDIQSYVQPSRDFHELFIKKYRNQKMIEILQAFDANLERARITTIRDLTNVPQLIKDYEDILETLRAGDADGAERALKIHLERTRGILQRAKSTRAINQKRQNTRGAG